jgi:MFS family permease
MPGARRWRVAAALFAVVFSASTPLAAFGVFLPALADAFGWSRGAISLALSINLVLGGLAAFLVGGLADRHGPRGVLLVAVVIAGGGIALASLTRTLWQLYLFVGVLGGIGTSGFYVIAASTVTRWFAHQRGLPLALVLAGFNLSYVTAGPIAAWLIERAGWRAAYLVFGIAACVIGSAASLMVVDPPRGATARDVPAPATHGLTLREALADRRLWLLHLCWLLLGTVLFMISAHVVSYARDRGTRLEIAALLLAAYGSGAAVGRVVFGALSDRLGSTAILRSCFALQIVALAVVPLGPPETVLLAMLALFGLGYTGADTVLVRVIPDVFGLRALGAITGVLTLGWRVGAAIGPPLAGFVHDAVGSYTVPFGLAPVILAVAFVVFRVGATPRR